MTYSVPSADPTKPAAALVRLEDFPQCSTGSPEPLIEASEHRLILRYLVFEPPLDLETLSDEPGLGEREAVVKFTRPFAHFFGPPNEEAISGHPYASLGLKPYDVFEVTNSDWIEGLLSRNAVHSRHSDANFAERRHFILAFHDSTFEVIAHDYSIGAGIRRDA